ncbi:pentatricopeptide repeat-containing protein [Dorcoceras hygrometricum]|uniref:Pentatricopeptide repeat-containing protein n=1 Tax=Dorcoceras hygrometricum TaxID=472368 RepID=A0A2Z7CT34_9LAMI|nr:pentatricopeptide repeat-containing protein [Dorcoceras hygrometricum]
MKKKNASFLAKLLQLCVDLKAQKAGKLLQAYILRTCHFSNIYLINRLIELYSRCGDTAAAHNLFNLMPVRNLFSYQPILDSYCKANDLWSAHDIFSHMAERNTLCWNLMIGALSRNGYKGMALEWFYRMRMGGLVPTRFTLAIVLSACGSLGDVVCGRECHGVAIKLALDGNVYVGNALLGMYMKCESVSEAAVVFRGLRECNEVSFTVMMEGLVEANLVNEAFGMFILMHRNGLTDSVSISSVLSVCSKFVVENDYVGRNLHNLHGKQIHGLALKLGFERDLHVNNSLLDMYAKHSNMESAEMLFNTMFEVNVVSWNVMIAGYGQQYNMGTVLEYIELMQMRGFKPDEVTNVNMVAACVKSGDIDTGRRIFDCISSPSLTCWNAMLSGYSQNEYHHDAVVLFKEMQFRNMRPDRTTFAIILISCAEMGLLEGGKQIHAILLKTEHYADPYVANGLICIYSKCGKLDVAKRIFGEVPQSDIVCWNSMLAGLSLHSLETEAFIFFKQMLGKGMPPTEFSYAIIIKCCSSLTSLSQGKQVQGLILKNGYGSDVYIGTSLIDLYCRCGEVDGAKLFFDMMPCKNTVTWNEMIHGYAHNGHGYEAVTLFENMVQAGIRPDSVTFVSVLTACSHSGLVDTGVKIFNIMHQEYRIKPLKDHYTCIIDSLGRAGRFSEIEVLIGNMDCKDDPILWEVLLGSCRVHSNVKLARRAAEELFRLNPNNSAPYALLVNMYSSLDRWDDVKYVGAIMNKQQITKEPGYSLV